MSQAAMEQPYEPHEDPSGLQSMVGPATRSVTPERSSGRLGLICGLLSVLGYTLANIALRRVASWDPAWVSAMKAVPTLLIMSLWLMWLGRRRVSLWPDEHGWRWLIAGALVGQFGGNWLFQWSLGAAGLAYAVPLSTASMIFGGALLGRVFLHEGLRPRTVAAMSLLILAAVVLSIGAQENSSILLPNADALEVASAPYAGWLGAAGALASGVAYAFLGVSIRRSVTRHVPIAVVMFVVSLTGVMAMGGVGLWDEGPGRLWAIPRLEYQWMLLAGIFTTAAFICLTIALRETSVTYVNCLSAVQVAASSVLGSLLFGELATAWLWAGVLLTVLGLWMLPHGEPVEKK